MRSPGEPVVEIREEPPSRLAEHARISIAFEVQRILEVIPPESGLGLVLRERVVGEPYLKDYDAVPGNRPEDWPRRFDIASWRLYSGWLEGRRVGGALLAWDTPGLDLLEGRRDLAVLFDLRIEPALRGRRIGTRLFAAAAEGARARGCALLKVETQNVNVPACRFYASQGCELGAIHRFAYPELPEEMQLLWYLDLKRRGAERGERAQIRAAEAPGRLSRGRGR